MAALALLALGGCHSAEKAARFAATRELGDPTSASFRGIRANHEGVICGEVSGKDRQGKETGFRKFAYYSHTGNSLIEPANVDEAYNKADYVCRTAKDPAAMGKACDAVRRLTAADTAHDHFIGRYDVDCR